MDDTSVSFFKGILKDKKRQQQKRSKTNQVSENKRYNTFRLRPEFKMIRSGIDLFTSPDKMRESLTEDHLYHFEHTDPHIKRINPDTPKYKGVLKVILPNNESVFVEPLDDDFKQMYKDRTDNEMCWELEDDDTPYWCDTYAHRKARKNHLYK